MTITGASTVVIDLDATPEERQNSISEFISGIVDMKGQGIIAVAVSMN